MIHDFFEIIKSIHVLSNLPIHVFNENFDLLKMYVSNITYAIPCDFKKIHNNINDKKNICLVSGRLDEVFLSYSFETITVILGPFLTNYLNIEDIKNKIQRFTCNGAFKVYLNEYLKLLPIFSLEDIQDICILLNFLFKQNVSCLHLNELYNQVHSNEIEIAMKSAENYNSQSYISEGCYEDQILDLVKKGDLNALNEHLPKISTSMFTETSGEIIRSKKNHTIIILEKLSSLAIQLGGNTNEIYQMRNYYIKKAEEKKVLLDVFRVTDCAIIHFTKKIHNVIKNKYSSLVKSIIHLVDVQLYSSIKVSEIANKLFASESSIRSKFKKETGLTIGEYINKRKIDEAKLLLESGVSPIEVSSMLDYYDYSHFYKTFKKFTEKSPKDYQFYDAKISI